MSPATFSTSSSLHSGPLFVTPLLDPDIGSLHTGSSGPQPGVQHAPLWALWVPIPCETEAALESGDALVFQGAVLVRADLGASLAIPSHLWFSPLGLPLPLHAWCSGPRVPSALCPHSPGGHPLSEWHLHHHLSQQVAGHPPCLPPHPSTSRVPAYPF